MGKPLEEQAIRFTVYDPKYKIRKLLRKMEELEKEYGAYTSGYAPKIEKALEERIQRLQQASK